MTILVAHSTPILAVDGVPSSSTSEQLLGRLSQLSRGNPGRDALRSRVIEANLALSRRLARRYIGRGESLEDLAQVAALALVKAVDGFDVAHGTPFVGYAIPSIIGALKRHFRDSGWAVRMPRATQELVMRVRTATAELAQRGGRPTPLAVASHLRIDVTDVWAALLAGTMYRLDSLDSPRSGGNESVGVLPDPGAVDRRYGDIDDRLSIGSLIDAMPPRERRILTMRFYDEMSQSQIAAEVGVSQMQISRLLKQSLTRLRADMLAGMVDGSQADGCGSSS